MEEAMRKRGGGAQSPAAAPSVATMAASTAAIAISRIRTHLLQHKHLGGPVGLIKDKMQEGYNVIIYGDPHPYNITAEKLLVDMLPELKKNGLTHLAIELAPIYSGYLFCLLEEWNRSPYPSTREYLLALRDPKLRETLSPSLLSNFPPNRRYTPFQIRAVEQAYRLGIKIVPFDLRGELLGYLPPEETHPLVRSYVANRDDIPLSGGKAEELMLKGLTHFIDFTTPNIRALIVIGTDHAIKNEPRLKRFAYLLTRSSQNIRPYSIYVLGDKTGLMDPRYEVDKIVHSAGLTQIALDRENFGPLSSMLYCVSVNIATTGDFLKDSFTSIPVYLNAFDALIYRGEDVETTGDAISPVGTSTPFTQLPLIDRLDRAGGNSI